MNSLTQLKQNFNKNLSFLYSQNEINSLWKNWVVLEILKLNLEDYYTDNFKLLNIHYSQINNLVMHLKDNKPVQYFFGYSYFNNLKIYVNANVLIPRPETEELVELVINKVDINDNYNMLDIGTGSGCIAIYLKKHIKGNMTGIDLDDKVLKTAKKNAKLNDVIIDFLKTDILLFNKFKHNKSYDLIVSNPPYVLKNEVSKLSNIHCEPSNAIFVQDNNPLVFYDKILSFSKLNLSKSGKIFFEINPNLLNQLMELINSYNYYNIEIFLDFSGKKRFIVVNS